MTTADLRVVMMVANDVTNDSRVRKEAAALAETGAEVTVLGVSASGLPSREMLDGALIVRVAVPFALREERKRSRTARRDWRPPLVGYKHRTSYVARSERIQAELKELKCFEQFSGGTGMLTGVGGGSGETRNWIMAAAVADRPGHVIDYIPVHASPCGVGYAYWAMDA